MEDKDLYGEKAIEKLKKIVKSVNVAMMCTTRPDGSIHSRPMGTAAIDGEGAIWFFSNDTSEKIQEIAGDKGLCLCYSKPTDNTYATVMGKAEVVDDKAIEKKLWNPLLKAWFPKGIEDPAMTLIKVKPYHAEYWDANDSRMVVFFKMAKAAMTGGGYTGSDSHGQMDL